MNKNLLELTAAQLRKVADLKDKITCAETEIDDIVAGTYTAQNSPMLAGAAPSPEPSHIHRHTTASRAALSRAMKRRWAKARRAGKHSLEAKAV